MSQRDELMEILSDGKIGPIPKLRPAFVKLGDIYFRPEDIKHFQASSIPGRTKLHMTNGDEWTVNMALGDVAGMLV